MPVNVLFASVAGISVALFAQGVEKVATEATYSAVSQLGLSIVLTVASFFLLIWWVRKANKEQRDDYVRMQKQVEDGEKFQREQLFGVLVESNAVHKRVAEATENNTQKMDEMTESVRKLNTRMQGRLCMAVESLNPEDRRRVYEMMARERLDDE